MRRTLTTGLSICAMVALGLSQATHAAPTGGAAAFVEAAMNGNRDAVRALLKDGADVNTTQADGMTALHWAAQKGDVELAKMLVYASANLKATTRIGGYTPLLIASKNGDAAMIDTLAAGRRGRQRPDDERHHAADARVGGRQAGRGDLAPRSRRAGQRARSGEGRDRADLRGGVRPRRRHPRAHRARRRRHGDDQGGRPRRLREGRAGAARRRARPERRRRRPAAATRRADAAARRRARRSPA